VIIVRQKDPIKKLTQVQKWRIQLKKQFKKFKIIRYFKNLQINLTFSNIVIYCFKFCLFFKSIWPLKMLLFFKRPNYIFSLTNFWNFFFSFLNWKFAFSTPQIHDVNKNIFYFFIKKTSFIPLPSKLGRNIRLECPNDFFLFLNFSFSSEFVLLLSFKILRSPVLPLISILQQIEVRKLILDFTHLISGL